MMLNDNDPALPGNARCQKPGAEASITHLFTHLGCVAVLSNDISMSGDPDWIRTNNLPLRRGLLYPVEPRGLYCNL